ncbi:MAG: fibronectin type III domain-containing protein [Acidobacteriota bacterium]
MMSPAVVVGLALMAGLSGCGKKGPPRPSIPRFPLESAAPRARQAGDRIEVHIPLPAASAAGVPVERFTGVRLYRIERPAGPAGAPPRMTGRDFPDTLRPIRVIENDEAAGLTPGSVLLHTEPVPALRGHGARALAYALRFRGAGRGWSPPFTPAVVVVSLPVPPPPAHLAVVIRPDGVQLTWEGDAAPVAVFRSAAGSAPEFLPRAVVAAGVATFVDTGVRFGQTYEYVVRAVAGNPDGHAYGAATAPVVARVIDTFPPAAPQKLAALARVGGVDLFWQPGDEADLAGYRVWRRQIPDGEWTLIAGPAIPTANWSDYTVVEGFGYEYAVSAVDTATPPNESPRSGSQSVSVPYAPQSRTPEPQ